MHWIVRVARDASMPGADQLDVAPRATTAKAWHAVVTRCGVDEDELAAAVAKWFRLGVADLTAADPSVAKFVPGSVAREFHVVPLHDEDNYLAIATANPTDVHSEQQVSFASGRSLILEIASPGSISEAIEATYSTERVVTKLADQVVVGGDAKPELDPRVRVLEEEAAPREAEEDEDADAGPIVNLTNMILEDAVTKEASDIHLQPLPTGGVIRLRIDGVLRSGITVPLPVLARVISRVKITSQLDISDKMRPQDGRAEVRIKGKKYDLRISTVPVRGGEKAVIRILDPHKSGVLDESGLPAREVDRLRRILRNRDGIFVVTGPTGSGKTTTMYAALREISSEDVNIMTVEDPVEYELPGLTQIQVDVKQGVTFQTSLKAILRQDPDVIFVGEIRDEATAATAAQASLTGHLVLTTVHANDAVGAVRRFMDLGLDAGTISETLRGALAQRLLRTLCTDCAQPVEDELDALEASLARRFGVQPTMRAVGCEACGSSGYVGRRPVVELIIPTADLLRLVAEEASHMELHAQARTDGMRTMLEGALDLVSEGLTTLVEVERVMGEESLVSATPTAAEKSADSSPPAPSVDDAPPTAVDDAPPAAVESPPTKTAERPQARSLVPKDAPEAGAVSRVLIVDDDADTRRLIRTVMESRGWDVVEASDGGTALVRIGTEKDLSLVLLDLGLPDIDGLGVLKAIRHSLATAHMPVIIITGKIDRDTERQLLLEGADDYIRKPVDPPILLMRSDAVLRRTRAV